jgi:hypothetical protein
MKFSLGNPLSRRKARSLMDRAEQARDREPLRAAALYAEAAELLEAAAESDRAAREDLAEALRCQGHAWFAQLNVVTGGAYFGPDYEHALSGGEPIRAVQGDEVRLLNHSLVCLKRSAEVYQLIARYDPSIRPLLAITLVALGRTAITTGDWPGAEAALQACAPVADAAMADAMIDAPQYNQRADPEQAAAMRETLRESLTLLAVSQDKQGKSADAAKSRGFVAELQN